MNIVITNVPSIKKHNMIVLIIGNIKFHTSIFLLLSQLHILFITRKSLHIETNFREKKNSCYSD